MKQVILIFCAHSDDEAVGMGGTIIRYIKEGKNIIKVVFSFGESSHPHLKANIIAETRALETEEISRRIGIKKTIFFGLRDTKLTEDLELAEVKSKLKRLIEKYKPVRIFIPSELDAHPDHRAVNKTVISALDGLDYKCDVLVFEVWGYMPKDKPLIYIDITPYFKEKISMMKQFKSQWHFIYPLLLPIYSKALLNGFKNKCRYAERFYKVR